MESNKRPDVSQHVKAVYAKPAFQIYGNLAQVTSTYSLTMGNDMGGVTGSNKTS